MIRKYLLVVLEALLQESLSKGLHFSGAQQFVLGDLSKIRIDCFSCQSPALFGFYSTTLRFGLAERAQVRLRIYDVSGRLVRTLVDGARGTGEHFERWNGTDSSGRSVASGVYFYRLEAGSFVETKKMVLLR